jgi:hypothetical protein
VEDWMLDWLTSFGAEAEDLEPEHAGRD